ISKFQIENFRSKILCRVIKIPALLLKIKEFRFKCYDSVAKSKYVVLCFCRGGGSERVVVVVVVVAIKIGA
ncbi:hypothetical protein Tco_0440847, partial [Tanacetum coccineum]